MSFIQFPKKIRKIGEQDLRISQEFPEKHFGEVPRSFSIKKFQRNSQEFLDSVQKNIPEKLSGIS